MQRVREHHIVLNRLLKDERLNPNRALLAEVLAMWTDTQGEEKTLITDILRSVWVSSKYVKWSDDDDPPTPAPGSMTEQQQSEQIKNVFASILSDASEATHAGS